jgi:uncharacterized protein (DUF1330 family)
LRGSAHAGEGLTYPFVPEASERFCRVFRFHKLKENQPMKTNYKLSLAVFVGVLIGVAGGTIHAQQAKTPPGYVVAEVAVTDPATMQKYGEKVPETLAPFNHHYVVRSDKTQSLEGEPPHGIVVIAFDSVEKAREWYDSPAYAAIRPLRQSAAKSRIFIVEGLASQ